MSLGQALSLNTNFKLKQELEEHDRDEYDWTDLGVICYGLRNDEGCVKVFMKLGHIIKPKKGYPKHLIDVIERYYGVNYGIENEEHHKEEKVLFHKPNNIIDLINRFKGEDNRTGVINDN